MTLRNRSNSQYQSLEPLLDSTRMMQKVGKRNIKVKNIPRSLHYFKDIVTTLLERRWRWMLSLCVLGYFASWLFFAGLYYLVAYTHGDLQLDADGNEKEHMCLHGATSFLGFMLMSVEAQVTTGFGERYPTDECPIGVFLLGAQLVASLIIDGTLVGIFIVKMVRPSRKQLITRFSRKMVICQRDGKLCLLFRMWDPCNSHYMATKSRVVLIEQVKCGEDGKPEFTQTPLHLDLRYRMILIWPMVMCHTIDANSPLYNMSAEDLKTRKFEILVTLTGDNRVTAKTTQARSSYMNSEILWGHRFPNIVDYNEEDGTYVVQDEKFDDTEQVETPVSSAKDMSQIYGGEQQEEYPENYYLGSTASPSSSPSVE